MRRHMKQMLEQWRKERNEAVMSMDVEKFKAFVLKWQRAGVYPKRAFPPDNVLEISMRKMACNITSLPLEVQLAARVWLNKHGYDATLGG